MRHLILGSGIAGLQAARWMLSRIEGKRGELGLDSRHV